MANEDTMVLIVSGTPRDGRRVETLLREADPSLSLERVQGPSEGLTRLRQARPDVVLFDMGASHATGLLALDTFLKGNGGVPIVVLTGLAEDDLAVRALRRGAQDCLAKGKLDGARLLRSLRCAMERHACQKKLGERERYYRSLLQSLHEDIVVVGRDLRICDVNGSRLRTSGHERQDVLGRHCYEVFHGRDAPCGGAGVQCSIGRVFETGLPAASEHLHLRRDGTKVPVSVLLSPLKDRHGNVTHVIESVRDITELVASRAASAASEAQLRGVVRNSTDGIAIVDAGGTILFVNPAAEELLGKTSQELVGTAFGFSTTGGTQDIEIPRPDGLTRSVEMRTTGMNWSGAEADLVLLHDITSRKQAEQEVERERRFSNAIVDTAGALICVLDPEGRIVRFNRACQEATGYTQEEVSGKLVWDVLVLPEERAQAEEVFESLKHDSEFLEFENHWLTKDGKKRLISWTNTRVLDESGRVRWIIATGLDVSEHRQLEEHVRRAARLEAVGQLAGGVAHDFNNLLTAIMGYIGLNLPEVPEGTRLAEDLRLAMTAAKRAADLTRQLLTFSRYQPFQPERIDLNVTIGDVCKMLRHLIEESVEIRVVLSEEPLTVKADPAQLGQVLMNLAVNARDAMPDGGVLTVETALEDGGAELAGARNSRRIERWARLSVCDTGMGIPSEIRDRIFDPFFTTKPPGHGTGLGLSTVYGIVRQHNGRIECQSEPGAGSRFTVRLPLAEGDTTAPNEASSEFRLGSGETILIVEDEDEVRELASRALRGYGYVVLEAADGPAALELLSRHDGALDLLLTDVVMPRMDGRELAQRVRLAHPHAKILFTSGYAGDAIDEAVGDQLARRMLQKPFSVRGLTRRVREALDGS